MKSIGFLTLLALFWFLLSGHVEPLLLGLGVVSVALTFYLSHRMNVIDHESYPLHLSYKMPGFYLYILKEVTKANIDVVARILKWNRSAIKPQLVNIQQSQATDLGAVIYANSITLTPGTVTIQLSDDKLLVHALSKESADELATGEMSKTITNRFFNQ
jgi:multicomponent Na+:H+ antiporter subunit E